MPENTSSTFQSCKKRRVHQSVAVSPSPFLFGRGGVQRGLPLASPMRDTRSVYPHGVGWLYEISSELLEMFTFLCSLHAHHVFGRIVVYGAVEEVAHLIEKPGVPADLPA